MSTAAPVILVVDDQTPVRQVACMALRSIGHEVVGVPSGEAALAVLDGRSDVDLVLLDCRMPGMTGPELAKAILARWPTMKLVATSGESCDSGMPAAASFIQKPYRPRSLRAHVAERLQG